MIRANIWLGILGVGFLLYIISRIFRPSRESTIDKEIEKVLTSDEHKVKGQYD